MREPRRATSRRTTAAHGTSALGIVEKLKRFRLRAFDRSDQLAKGERTVENTDAGAGMINPNPMAPGPAPFPPDYVKPDDGRPRH
jgi:hypothetical protein